MGDYYLVAELRGQHEDEVTRIDTTGMDDAQQAVQRSVAIGLARANVNSTGRRTFVYGPTDEGVDQTEEDRVWDSTVDV
jgi:hypothetical protein